MGLGNSFRRDNDSVRAAREELRSAEEALSAQYWHMVDRYVGRERSIPDHVPEMRENTRLQELVSDRKSIVMSLSGKQRDGDLEYSEALGELWDRAETEEDQRYVESLSDEMDPLTGNRRAEIERAVREGRDGDLTDLYVQWDQEIITAGLDEREQAAEREVDPLTPETRDAAVNELDLGREADLPELAPVANEHEVSETNRDHEIDDDLQHRVRWYDAFRSKSPQEIEDDREVKKARRGVTPEQRQAAIDKYLDAAHNIEHGIGDYHEQSDRFIEAQYEGLPRRYLLPGWLGMWRSRPASDDGLELDAEPTDPPPDADLPGGPNQIDRDQLGGWAREGYLNTVDPLTVGTREAALDELEIAVAEELAEDAGASPLAVEAPAQYLGYADGEVVRDVGSGITGRVRVRDDEETGRYAEVQWDGLFVADELNLAIDHGLEHWDGSQDAELVDEAAGSPADATTTVPDLGIDDTELVAETDLDSASMGPELAVTEPEPPGPEATLTEPGVFADRAGQPADEPELATEPALPAHLRRWIQKHNVQIIDGDAVLYKAVNDVWRSPRGAYYEPGTTTAERKWFGSGLYFSPTPGQAQTYNGEATKCVEVRVPLGDLDILGEGDKVRSRSDVDCVREIALDHSGTVPEPEVSAAEVALPGLTEQQTDEVELTTEQPTSDNMPMPELAAAITEPELEADEPEPSTDEVTYEPEPPSWLGGQAQKIRGRIDDKVQFAKAWVAELRSGRHKQCCGAWQETGVWGGTKECTIQVANNEFGVTTEDVRSAYGEGFVSEVLNRNDVQRHPFDKIATYIEREQLEGHEERGK